MIAAGIALIAAVFIALIAATVWARGWKFAAGIWGFTAVGTAALAGGAWLLDMGLSA